MFLHNSFASRKYWSEILYNLGDPGQIDLPIAVMGREIENAEAALVSSFLVFL